MFSLSLEEATVLISLAARQKALEADYLECTSLSKKDLLKNIKSR